ncbi:gluconate 2-dehydrogenase subunit 3 family protein [Occallatibacter savannae]|uniref:gluconate 2-dehydrogenase subunit 3 family protein n=1 Tax=Occallatibacter savannae TaxID=1002691 RepID=UPI000D699459|nr:gluconate 2-dehydrogenase subunit 3 family protein [Occallatibacter savannae]
MTNEVLTRRAVLKSLTLGAAVGSVMKVIPLEAAEAAHHLVQAEKQSTGAYAPKYFKGDEYKTLQSLCDTIIPADADAGGAVEAGAPEFIDLLTSENKEYQKTLGGGLKWLDATCSAKYGKTYLACAEGQRKEVLDRIAYRKNADAHESLTEPVEFFTLLRNMTADGFFTSKIGIKYLGYKGNTFLTHFDGCPPVEGV